MTDSGFCYMPVCSVSFIWFVLFVWLTQTNQRNQMDQTDQTDWACPFVRLRTSTAGMTVRVVLLRHAAPARRFLAACRGGDDRHQGCREQLPR